MLFTSRGLARTISSFLIASSGLLAACSSSTDGESGADDGAVHSMPTTGDTAAGSVSCVADPRVEDVEARSLEKSGDLGVLDFVVLGTEPFPPAKGDNTFRVQIRDEQGELVDGPLLVDAKMPDHGHGARVAPEVTFDPDAREYVISPLNFFMPGVWEIDLQCPSEDSDAMIDSVQFFFCVEG